ncbi:DUF2145 domain-containing protein [Litorimonas sp. RW-G-Af-16]|uniref:DUF2145 domain-containing protein n=1 Tax=Litorimonas sp. RW-G-Af-16 TaxID=3241168 RepID=UPI00390C7A66
MSLLAKILIGVVLALVIAVFGFGWHIKTVYAGFVASTDSGDALFPPEILADYGRQIQDELIRQDVQVAIISRSGQKREKLPDGVMFTHSAFFRRAEDGSYAVYNLYHGEDNRLISSLKTDTPADFLRLLQEKDAGILIPNKTTQLELYDFLESPEYAAVHTRDYSLISNPFDLRWQNCNEFMLYAVAAMFWDTTDREAIRQRLITTIEPTELKASLIRRHIGPKVDERLIMADHGDKIITTTFGTLTQLFEREGRLQESYVLAFEG